MMDAVSGEANFHAPFLVVKKLSKKAFNEDIGAAP